MISIRQVIKTPLFLFLLLLIFTTNIALYHLPISILPIPAEATGVVVGSLFDFAIVVPLLILAITRKRGFTIKRFIPVMVLGIITARIIIPDTYFEPFVFFSNTEINVNALLLISLLIKHIPCIIKDVNISGDGPLFDFVKTVESRVGKNLIIRILCTEIIMFYYAFASWKKRGETGGNQFTIHTKTSLIAFYVMLIHAIVMETIGIHFWLHDKSMILSVVLLILNIYAVVFFLGDIQAVRLNPLTVDEKHIRVSLGFGKRMIIPFDEIEHISWDHDAAKENTKTKGTIDFIARDFEEFPPQCIVTFKRPLKATLIFGFEREFSKAALRVDDPVRFRKAIDDRFNTQ